MVVITRHRITLNEQPNGEGMAKKPSPAVTVTLR